MTWFQPSLLKNHLGPLLPYRTAEQKTPNIPNNLMARSFLSAFTISSSWDSNTSIVINLVIKTNMLHAPWVIGTDSSEHRLSRSQLKVEYSTPPKKKKTSLVTTTKTVWIPIICRGQKLLILVLGNTLFSSANSTPPQCNKNKVSKASSIHNQ